MTLTQLNYVLALEEQRNFHKAAKACAISQPTLSQQIQKLEDSLGLIIFDRSKKPLIPTQEGEVFIRKARKIIGLSKELENFNYTNEGVSGEFKLGVIPTLAPSLIPSFVGPFLNQFPGVKLILEEMKTEEIIEQLEEDKIDGGLLVTPLDHPKINERKLYFEQLFFFCHPGHELLEKKTVDPRKISPTDLWVLEKGHCFRDQTLNLCDLDAPSQSEAQLIYQAGSLETLKDLVEKFGGMTLLPESVLQGLSPKQRKNQILKLRGAPPLREVSLVHSRLFEKEAILEALEKTILSNLPSHAIKKGRLAQIVPIYK